MKSKKTLCTFYVDKLLFGVDVSEVQEVLRAQNMTDVPLAPDVVSGLMNLRGQIVTALDMRQLLCLQPTDETRNLMNVLIRTGDTAVSLLVDEIGDVIDVQQDQFEPAPESVPKNVWEMIDGVFKLDDELLLCLNTSKLDRRDYIKSASRNLQTSLPHNHQ